MLIKIGPAMTNERGHEQHEMQWIWGSTSQNISQ